MKYRHEQYQTSKEQQGCNSFGGVENSLLLGQSKIRACNSLPVMKSEIRPMVVSRMRVRLISNANNNWLQQAWRL